MSAKNNYSLNANDLMYADINDYFFGDTICNPGDIDG